ncbi:MAG: M20/M25/M40 family metallo-hydrolase [Thaumarchaeota archaeon]|nr:M20/M25/M40 family metallo-hydrolase [Nitrososphaerota archaeon]
MLLDEKVREYVHANQGRFVQDISRLVAQPSVSARNEGLQECSRLVAEMIREIGGTSRILGLEGAPPLVYGEVRSDRSEKTILFYNHYDVQPEAPLDLWLSPPFKPEVREGRLYGRGVSDDKGELVARLKLVESYVRLHGEPPCNIKFCFEGEEEVGSGHLPGYVSGNPGLFESDAINWEDGMITRDGTPLVSLGAKGMMYLELACRSLSHDAHSKYAAALPSASWRLTRLLETIKDGNERILIDGWYDDVKELTPEELQMLRDEPSEVGRLPEIYGSSGFAAGMSRFEATVALTALPTANIAGIWAGYEGAGSKTVLPAEARCKIDLRLVPDQEPDVLFQRFLDHLGKHGCSDVEVTKMTMEPAARTSYRSGWAQAALKAASTVFGTRPAIELSSAGTGPFFVFTRRYDVPIISIGVSPSDAGAHSPNESLRLDYLEKGMLWMGETIEEFLAA